MNVYDSSPKRLHWLKAFHLAFIFHTLYIYIYIYIFINTTQFLSIYAMKFFIFHWRIRFRHHTNKYILLHIFLVKLVFEIRPFQLFLFLEIDVWTAFSEQLFHRKLNVRRYIRPSLLKYQDQTRLLASHPWQA